MEGLTLTKLQEANYVIRLPIQIISSPFTLINIELYGICNYKNRLVVDYLTIFLGCW